MSEHGELPRFEVQCWGCEGRPSGDNDPCDVCGRSSKQLRAATTPPAGAQEAPVCPDEFCTPQWPCSRCMSGESEPMRFAQEAPAGQEEQPVVTVPQAMAVVREALQADPDYAWTWHCNVAMASQDEGLDHYRANKAAARFMVLLSGVDTSKSEYFDAAPPQAPATVQGERSDWRLAAANWLRMKADEQQRTNVTHPAHAEAYPSWRHRVDDCMRMAEELEMFAAAAPFGLEPWAVQNEKWPTRAQIAAVDSWFANNTGLGGCSDADVEALHAILAVSGDPSPPPGAQQAEAAPAQAALAQRNGENQ